MSQDQASPSAATRAAARVALATCAALPELDPDDQALIPALAAQGIAAEPAVWDAAGVDWAAYDLVVIRNTWDYFTRKAQFLAWARSVPALANPAPVIEWNTDKRYLREFEAKGIPIVPTVWVEPGDAWDPAASPWPEIVVKPAVSAGSIDTGRYDLAHQAGEALALVRRLQAAGRLVMVQPYLSAVDTAGETALLYFAGTFSHAIRKGAILTGPYVPTEQLYQIENIQPRTPSEPELALAERVLAALPAADLLYVRVDLVPAPDGPVVIEVELTEPSLFFGHAEGAADRFAAAVRRRLQ